MPAMPLRFACRFAALQVQVFSHYREPAKSVYNQRHFRSQKGKHRLKSIL